jgi:hypothetical protein
MVNQDFKPFQHQFGLTDLLFPIGFPKVIVGLLEECKKQAEVCDLSVQVKICHSLPEGKTGIDIEIPKRVVKIKEQVVVFSDKWH